HVVRRRTESLEFRWCVARRRKGFGIDTTVLGPDNTEVPCCERDGQVPAVENLVRDAVRSRVRHVELAEANEVAGLDEAAHGATRRLSHCHGTRLLEQR